MSDDEAFAELIAPIPFERFMDLMRHEFARDLVRKINRFLQEFESAKPDPARDSRLLQNFLEKMEKEFYKHRLWQSLPEQEQIIANEGLEKYILTKLYDRSFLCYEEDKERDLVLSTRMASLQFVSPSHLDIPRDLITNEAMLLATKELQKINAVKAPRDKLVCLLKCCKAIINLLRSAGKSSEGADIFMPILNYVVIKAQPECLISNIEFIKRYRMKSKLTSYTEYYFTQLCGSACFIETADAGSFTNGKQEFLSSFLQNGLISWRQYEEALQENSNQHKNPTFQLNSDNILIEDVPSTISDGLIQNKINWEGVSTIEDIYLEGIPFLIQLSSNDALVSQYPFLNAAVTSLTVEDVSILLSEYKSLALSYEILAESTSYRDTDTILRLISESDVGQHWKSMLPSQSRLLSKYRYLCASLMQLTFSQVTQLLNDYKLLVLQYEALEQGLRARITGCSILSTPIYPSSSFDLLTADFNYASNNSDLQSVCTESIKNANSENQQLFLDSNNSEERLSVPQNENLSMAEKFKGQTKRMQGEECKGICVELESEEEEGKVEVKFDFAETVEREIFVSKNSNESFEMVDPLNQHFINTCKFGDGDKSEDLI